MTLIQKIEFAALLAILSCGAGCTSLTPAQAARADKFECQVAALAPLVEPTLDAAELARELYRGSADLGRVLKTLDASQAELAELLERLHNCEPPVPVPAGEPS